MKQFRLTDYRLVRVYYTFLALHTFHHSYSSKSTKTPQRHLKRLLRDSHALYLPDVLHAVTRKPAIGQALWWKERMEDK